MNTTSLPAELTSLRELVGTLQEALALTRQENTLLRQKIDALVRRVFGASSETVDRAQLELLLQLASPAAAPVAPVVPVAKVPAPRPRKEAAPRLPEHLPVVEEVIEPEPVKAQPEQWRCIGQEVSEQLDYEPARFLCRRLIRKKYVHRTEVDCWPRCWSPSTPTICRCTGRNKFTRNGTKCPCPGKRWRAGWSWRRIGCGRFTSKLKRG